MKIVCLLKNELIRRARKNPLTRWLHKFPLGGSPTALLTKYCWGYKAWKKTKLAQCFLTPCMFLRRSGNLFKVWNTIDLFQVFRYCQQKQNKNINGCDLILNSLREVFLICRLFWYKYMEVCRIFFIFGSNLSEMFPE